MARTLSSRDLEILKKLVPELESEICMHSGHNFRSILPPVSQHFTSSPAEFGTRLDRLTEDELKYIVDLIFLGEESLGCLQDEHIDILLDRVRQISRVTADDLVDLLGYIKEE